MTGLSLASFGQRCQTKVHLGRQSDPLTLLGLRPDVYFMKVKLHRCRLRPLDTNYRHLGPGANDIAIRLWAELGFQCGTLPLRVGRRSFLPGLPAHSIGLDPVSSNKLRHLGHNPSMITHLRVTSTRHSGDTSLHGHLPTLLLLGIFEPFGRGMSFAARRLKSIIPGRHGLGG